MSEFRRRLLIKKDNGELKENEILAVYNVTTTESSTTLLGKNFTLSNITKMKINGVQVTPTKTYTFNEIGEIPVIMTINPNATSLAYMFGESKLRFADMSNFEALKVTSLLQAFYGTWSLKEVIVNTPNVTNMQSVLSYSSFKKFTFSNMSKVKNAHRMFCGSIITNIESFDIPSATNMREMFAGCANIETIPQFDTSSATDMSVMFRECKKIDNIPLLDTHNVTTMLNMFYGCTNLKTIPQFDTSNVSNMQSLFCECSSLETIPQIDTSKVTTMYWMFRNCRKLVSVPLLDATNVADTWNMFENCTSLKNLGGFKNLSISLNLSNSNLLTPLSIHNIIEQALGGFTLTLHATAKTNWQNIEYFYSDYLMLKEKNITISGLTIITINIPEGVTTIPDNAFSELTSLTSVTIPEGVNTIGNNAFANCSSLTSITIPSTVTYIGDNAFSECSQLDLVTFQSINAPTLGENVFENIANNGTCTIPENSVGYDNIIAILEEKGWIIITGYTPKSYLESDKTNGQYINTNYLVKSTDVIRITFEFVKYNTSQPIFGWRWSGSYSDTNQCYVNTDTNIIKITIGASSGQTKAIPITLKTQYTLEINPNTQKILLNGIEVSVNNSGIDWNAIYSNGNSVYPPFLFTLNNMGTKSGANDVKIYDYVVYDINGVEVQHLIPALDMKNKPCMVDLVRRVYHYNQASSGDFIY